MQEKRNKHVLISLTDAQYKKLCKIADTQRRKLADAAYLLLIDSIDIKILKVCDEGSSNYVPLEFINDDEK